jgi:outer membrane usher protein
LFFYEPLYFFCFSRLHKCNICVLSKFFLILCLWNSHNALAESKAESFVAPEPTLALYDTKVNQKSVGDGRFLRSPSGGLYVHEEDFKSWRLRRSNSAEFKFDNQTWLLLSGLPGVDFKINETKQAIQIEASVQAFFPSTLATEPAWIIHPSISSLGGFANYDLLGSGANGIQQLSGAFDLNLFGAYGTLSSGFVGQSLFSQTRQASRLIRQDTVWSRDWSDEMLNVQVGDTQGKGGLWGHPVNFGGVRWGRNFAAQPGFVSNPTPALAGEAVLPSTVDLYIDGVVRKSLNVPSGPFSLSDFPQVTGQGEAKLIVRDSLGREQIIVAPYAASGGLLKQDVIDYSIDAGFIRKNYGLNSNDYGKFMASATFRKGLSERITIEGRGEFLRDQQSGGFGGSVLTAAGVATAAVVTSHSSVGLGTLGMLSLERQGSKVSFGLRGQSSSANFLQIGGGATASASRTLSANLGWQLGGGNTLGASYAQRGALNQPVNKVASLNYGTQLNAGLSLNISLLATLSAPKSNSLMFFLVKPINDKGGSAMLSGNVQNKHIEQPTLQVQQTAWRNGDLGYRALLVGGNNQRQEAGLTLRSQQAIYTADASHAQATVNYRLGIQGGVAILEGQTFATQRINDSFGLVHVPDYPNLEVSSNNQVVARTNSKGDALLPDIWSYRANTIGIDSLALPLDAQLVNSQQTLVPYFRSGLSTTFTIKRSRSAVLMLILDDGKPAPVGMNVKVDGVSETFTLGMRGEVFITELQNSNKVQAEWGGNTCRFDYSLPAGTNTTVYSEPIICAGVQR